MWAPGFLNPAYAHGSFQINREDGGLCGVPSRRKAQRRNGANQGSESGGIQSRRSLLKCLAVSRTLRSPTTRTSRRQPRRHIRKIARTKPPTPPSQPQDSQNGASWRNSRIKQRSKPILLQKNEYFVSFLTLSRPFENTIENGTVGFGMPCQFAILTKEPVPELPRVELNCDIGNKMDRYMSITTWKDADSGKASILRVAEDEKDLLDRYSKTFFRCLVTPRFFIADNKWKVAHVVPIGVRGGIEENGENWELSWDMVRNIVEGHGGLLVNNLLKAVAQLDGSGEVSEKCLDYAKEVVEYYGGGQGLGDPDTNPWGFVDNVMKSFLAECKGSKLYWVKGLARDAIEKKMYKEVLESGADMPSQPFLKLKHLGVDPRTIDELFAEISEPYDRCGPAEQYRILPIPAQWLVTAQVVRQSMVSLKHYLRAEKLRELLEMPDLVPPWDLIKALNTGFTVSEDLKRLEYVGDTSLVYILATEGFVEYSGAMRSKETAVSIAEFVRIRALAEVLSKKRDVVLLLINDEGRDDLARDWDPDALDAPLYTLVSSDDESEADSDNEEEKDRLDPAHERMVGRSFKAVLGVCYLYGGVFLVRRVCMAAGVLETTNEMFDRLEGGYESLIDSSFKYSWEWKKPEGRLPLGLQQLTTVEETLGYKFNNKARLMAALRHPSLRGNLLPEHRALSDASQGVAFKWLYLVGGAALDLVLAHHVQLTSPKLTQTEVHQLLREIGKIEMYGRLVGQLGLYKHMVHTVENLDRIMNDSAEELSQLESNTLTGFKPPRVWSDLFRSLAGAVLLDSHFSVDEFQRIFLPKLLQYLPSMISLDINELEGNKINKYRRFIPRTIEACAFGQGEGAAQIPETDFYGTLLKYGPPLNGMGGEEGSKGNRLRAFVVLTKHKLPELPPVDVYGTPGNGEACSVSLEPFRVRRMSLKEEELKLVEDFQTRFFKPIAVPSRMEAVTIGELVKKYYIVPAYATQGTKKVTYRLDWDLVKNTVLGEAPAKWSKLFSMLASKQLDDKSVLKLAKSIASEKSWEATNASLMKEDTGDAEVDPTVQSVVQGILLQTDAGDLVQAHSFCHGKPGHPETTTVRGRIMNFSGCMNCLKPNDMFEESRECSVTFSKCEVSPLTVALHRRARTLPSILFRMEGALLVHDFRTLYSISPKVPDSVLLSAMTSGRALDLAYGAHLESLGVCVLKYVVSLQIFLRETKLGSGEMSRKTSEIVQRDVLAVDEHTYQIAGHLGVNPFNPHKARTPWVPPSMEPFVWNLIDDNSEPIEIPTMNPATYEGDEKYGISRQVSESDHPVSVGMVNSHTKAIVGAIYLHVGLDAAADFMQTVGIVELAEKPAQKSGKRFKHSRFNMLERNIGYRFKDMTHLGTAFIHHSMRMKVDYDRLEFLGDAALDLLLVKYLQEKHPNMPIGDIATLKRVMVSNETFARVAVLPPLRLHTLLMHKVNPMSHAMRQFERIALRKKDEPPGALGTATHKVAGDILESLVGAVLVDCGFCLETVASVVHIIMEDFLARWIDGPDPVVLGGDDKEGVEG